MTQEEISKSNDQKRSEIEGYLNYCATQVGHTVRLANPSIMIALFFSFGQAIPSFETGFQLPAIFSFLFACLALAFDFFQFLLLAILSQLDLKDFRARVEFCPEKIHQKRSKRTVSTSWFLFYFKSGFTVLAFLALMTHLSLMCFVDQEKIIGSSKSSGSISIETSSKLLAQPPDYQNR